MYHRVCMWGEHFQNNPLQNKCTSISTVYVRVPTNTTSYLKPTLKRYYTEFESKLLRAKHIYIYLYEWIMGLSSMNGMDKWMVEWKIKIIYNITTTTGLSNKKKLDGKKMFKQCLIYDFSWGEFLYRIYFANETIDDFSRHLPSLFVIIFLHRPRMENQSWWRNLNIEYNYPFTKCAFHMIWMADFHHTDLI